VDLEEEGLVVAEPEATGKLYLNLKVKKMADKKEKIVKIYGEELFICPRCKVKMEKLKKNNVIIDVCKKCKGMWLDHGEMEKLYELAHKKG
jgi:hypothetical protein